MRGSTARSRAQRKVIRDDQLDVRRQRREARLGGLRRARRTSHRASRYGSGASRSSSADRTPDAAAHATASLARHRGGPERIVEQQERRHDRARRAVAGPLRVRIFRRQHAVLAGTTPPAARSAARRAARTRSVVGVQRSWLPGVQISCAKRGCSVRSTKSRCAGDSPVSPAMISQSSGIRGQRLDRAPILFVADVQIADRPELHGSTSRSGGTTSRMRTGRSSPSRRTARPSRCRGVGQSCRNCQVAGSSSSAGSNAIAGGSGGLQLEREIAERQAPARSRAP